MARVIFDMKQGDLKPALQVTLKDGDGVAVNVTGATVKFSMRNQATRALKINEGTVTLVTAASGIVRYDWVAGDTDTPGLYDAEFEVTYAGPAGPETFPNNDEHFFTVRVNREIA